MIEYVSATVRGVVRGMTRGFALALPILLIAALTIGMSHGYEAESASDATIERGPDYNKTTLETDSGSEVKYDPLPLVPNEWQPGTLQPYSPQPGQQHPVVKRFTWAVLDKTMSVASGVSVWTFHNRSWIDVWWAEKLLQSATGLYVIGLAGAQYRRLR